MKKKSILFIFIISICAIAGGVLIFTEINKRLDEVTVYVAKENIDVNQKINNEMLKEVKKKSYYLTPGTLQDKSMIGMVANQIIYKEEPIMTQKLSESSNVDLSLGYQLSPDERIISVTVDNAGSIGGLISKGQYVDIEWIRPLGIQQGEMLSVLLYEHIEVIDIRYKNGVSVEQEVTKSGKINIVGSDVSNAGTEQIYPLEIILRVDKQQRTDINLAEEIGKIKLSINPHRQNDGNKKIPINTIELSQGGISVEQPIIDHSNRGNAE